MTLLVLKPIEPHADGAHCGQCDEQGFAGMCKAFRTHLVADYDARPWSRVRCDACKALQPSE